MLKRRVSLFVVTLVWTLALGVKAQDTLEEIQFRVERFEIVGDNPIGDYECSH